ncbi:MAG: PTS sugar transporter subunit IIA [Phycisphaerae bacterium]|jgi:mannitol/fructose-specific phosphotransferase system IIA component (Ntr-type)|nr:PTS sugar transporter subunit IIA [Phycisphaerae bacterium]
MKLADIIVPEAIIPSLAATTRDEAIAEIMGALADAGAIAGDSVEDVTAALLAREAQSTTGIGNGVAFPHARIKGIKEPLGAIGCSADGIDFNSLDGLPVDMVVLLLSNPEEPGEHLEAMEAVFRHIQRQAFRDEIRACETQDEIANLVQKAD